jgi:uncharacterized protein (TIGR03083 family)
MDISKAIRDERLDLIEHLDGLTAEQWDAPSLCDKWRIRDVVAHLTAGAEGAYGIGATVSGMLRHGLSFNRWIANDSRTRGDQDPSQILNALRAAVDNRKKPPGAPRIAGLADLLIHGQDICRPLGIDRTLPEDHLLPVADFVRSTFVFHAKRRTEGLTLKATDMTWSHGSGPEVAGTAEALVMAMAGRQVALSDLSGGGVALFASRY